MNGFDWFSSFLAIVLEIFNYFGLLSRKIKVKSPVTIVLNSEFYFDNSSNISEGSALFEGVLPFPFYHGKQLE